MRNQNNENFLQPIFSTFGLIISLISAVSPIFAQGQLGNFFLESSLSLPASIVSVLLGIILSWQLISKKGFINMPLGKRKDRGNGFNEPWKNINNDNIIALLVITMVVLFLSFFSIAYMSGYVLGVVQATIYVLFFMLLIATFSLLLAKTRNTYEWEQQLSNVGATIYETLEKSGNIKTGIKIQQNSIVQDMKELDDTGISSRDQFLVRKLIIETVPQDAETFRVYMSSDYKSLLAAIPLKDTNKAAANK